DEDLLRTVAYPCRVIDDERLRMDAFKQAGGGYVVHIEGRVLTKQDHVHFRHVCAHRFTKREVIALHISKLHLLNASENLSAKHGEPVRGVVEEPVAAPLRLKRQGETRVAGDRDG